MSKVVGFCNLHNCPSLGELTSTRPMGPTTFLGRYGIMDFTMSNFSNSGIGHIGILIDRNIRSVQSHVGTGRPWINNTKKSGVKLFLNEKDINTKNNTDINNIRQNFDLYPEMIADDYIISVPYFVTSFDFRNVLEKHSGQADITIICKEVEGSNTDFATCKCLRISNGLVDSFIPFDKKIKNLVCLDTYILSKKAFEYILSNFKDDISLDKAIEKIIENKTFKVHYFENKGYVAPIISFEQYCKQSFDLLNYSMRLQLFKPDWPIYTVTNDTPPAIFGSSADVKNSFVANGCKINGEVKNSILSRNVVVKKGTSVNNCILFSNTVIYADAQKVITDKNVALKNKSINKEMKLIKKEDK